MVGFRSRALQEARWAASRESGPTPEGSSSHLCSLLCGLIPLRLNPEEDILLVFDRPKPAHSKELNVRDLITDRLHLQWSSRLGKGIVDLHRLAWHKSDPSGLHKPTYEQFRELLAPSEHLQGDDQGTSYVIVIVSRASFQRLTSPK